MKRRDTRYVREMLDTVKDGFILLTMLVILIYFFFTIWMNLFYGSVDFIKHFQNRQINWDGENGVVISSQATESCGIGKRKFELLYQFQVGTDVYNSNNMGDYEGYCGDDEDIKLLLSHYPVGKTIKVFYDVLDPTHSVLDIRQNFSGALTCAVLFLVLHLFLLVGGIRMYRSIKADRKLASKHCMETMLTGRAQIDVAIRRKK
jgi:hypothetical protein